MGSRIRNSTWRRKSKQDGSGSPKPGFKTGTENHARPRSHENTWFLSRKSVATLLNNFSLTIVRYKSNQYTTNSIKNHKSWFLISLLWLKTDKVIVPWCHRPIILWDSIPIVRSSTHIAHSSRWWKTCWTYAFIDFFVELSVYRFDSYQMSVREKLC